MWLSTSIRLRDPLPSRSTLSLTSQSSPLPAVPTTPREPRIEAAAVLVKGIFILISFSHARDVGIHRIPSATRVRESDKELERGVFGLSSMYPSPMSYLSTSTLSNSVVTTPAFVAFPLHAEFQDCSSPQAQPVVIESSPSSSRLLVPHRPPDLPHHPTIQILPVHKYTSDAPAPLNLAAKQKSFSPNRILWCLGSTSGYPHRDSPPTSMSQIDLALFPSNVGDTRIRLLAVSTFHERLIRDSESKRHTHQPSTSFNRNSNY